MRCASPCPRKNCRIIRSRHESTLAGLPDSSGAELNARLRSANVDGVLVCWIPLSRARRLATGTDGSPGGDRRAVHASKDVAGNCAKSLVERRIAEQCGYVAGRITETPAADVQRSAFLCVHTASIEYRVHRLRPHDDESASHRPPLFVRQIREL